MISRQTQYHIIELILLLMAIAAGAAMIMQLIVPVRSILVMFCAAMVFTASLILSIRLWLDPDRVRASQSDAMLTLASETLEAMRSGFNEQSAQEICDLLLPATSAIAVAITGNESILGYSGQDKDLNQTGAPIRTVATHATLEDGKMRIMRSADEIGFPVNRHSINAAIIVPLDQGGETIGTLKFYYPNARKVNESQQSIAVGFGELLSTQLDAAALQDQKKLATSMELKALQSQINPHFLFNTINTIASFIRTDPAKARELLREFSKFYRSTLENNTDLITLWREVEQTARYLTFEMARFGEDRLAFKSNIPDELSTCLVPAFMVQPLVENAVKHGMPQIGQLSISVDAQNQGNDLVLHIIDDGTGMDEEQVANIMSTSSSTGLGIAVRNINDRIMGYYGSDSSMKVESAPGEGTVVTLFLKDALTKGGPDAENQAVAS